ncbi:acyl-CoA synthetase [Prauserella marina]|uniref:Fatty-acyl-CoA synthase n=1 Tax=Prauserella marina TaxID=530584 RepID=A0A222VN16_9PSEU|nr:acyl-CoA synthetase [Prauserella marina]ASR35308.1 acyl-CoA synthetase [Prauserella marina]PWV84909.1 fatty-acyl-CoA synthase [Prauserella marina]SDC09749.1 fatty-acyl-CoA synthase [Prauserella marina]
MYPDTHAAVHPDRPAVVLAESGAVLGYRALAEQSARLANVFRAEGLRKGDTVALLTDNALPAYEVYWAAVRSGLYLAAVNSHLGPDEAAYIVADSGAKALVVSAAIGELATEVARRVRVPVRLAFGGQVEGFDDYAKVVANASASVPEDQPAGADLLYSSGTTGRPKGIKVALPSHQIDEPGNILLPLLQAKYGFSAGMVYLSPAPVYHAAPLRFGACVHAVGGTLVMMERFEAEAALRAIERYRVTHSQWVPTMFVRMLKLPESGRSRYDLSSHQVAVHAAAPCPVEVKHEMMSWWGPILHEYYSSTEGAGMTFIGPEEWLGKPGSVGREGLGVVRICAEDGSVLPAGSTGTVYFERDEPAFEYHNDEPKTRSARHPGHPNWATNGDIGRLDDDGYLYLTDRAAFTIISGGVNIYPQETENVLALHPAVHDVAVIGVPDAELGEVAKALVQPESTAEPGPELAEELLAHVRARIAHYKAPRSVDFVTDLPRTPTGKLLKHELRARYRDTAPDQRG